MSKNFLDKARKTASRDKPKSVCVWKIIWKNLDILKLLGGSEMIWKIQTVLRPSGKWEVIWRNPDKLSGFSVIRAKTFRGAKLTMSYPRVVDILFEAY